MPQYQPTSTKQQTLPQEPLSNPYRFFASRPQHAAVHYATTDRTGSTNTTPPTHTEKSEWEELLESYKKAFQLKPKTDKSGRAVLSFRSQHEAELFFREEANKGRRFLALEVNANGTPTGNYLLSFGDGVLHRGQVKPDAINKISRAWAHWNHTQDSATKQLLETELKGGLQPPKSSVKTASSREQKANSPSFFQRNTPKPAPATTHAPNTAPSPLQPSLKPY